MSCGHYSRFCYQCGRTRNRRIIGRTIGRYYELSQYTALGEDLKSKKVPPNIPDRKVVAKKRVWRLCVLPSIWWRTSTTFDVISSHLPEVSPTAHTPRASAGVMRPEKGPTYEYFFSSEFSFFRNFFTICEFCIWWNECWKICLKLIGLHAGPSPLFLVLALPRRLGSNRLSGFGETYNSCSRTQSAGTEHDTKWTGILKNWTKSRSISLRTSWSEHFFNFPGGIRIISLSARAMRVSHGIPIFCGAWASKSNRLAKSHSQSRTFSLMLITIYKKYQLLITIRQVWIYE